MNAKTPITPETNRNFVGATNNDNSGEEEDFDVSEYFGKTNVINQKNTQKWINDDEEEEDIDVMGINITTTKTNTFDKHENKSKTYKMNIMDKQQACHKRERVTTLYGTTDWGPQIDLQPRKKRKLTLSAACSDYDLGDLEEDEEEEDFDVMEINVKTQIRKNELKTFGIGNILSNIVSNLSIVEIIKLRAVNKLFNGELTFGFECNNFNIHFYYKNKYIINIINHQYCNSLEIFTLFYLQSFNIKKSAFAFKRVRDKNTHTNCKKNEDCEEKSGLTQRYIFSVSTNNEFRDDIQPCPHFDLNVDFDIVCKYGNAKMNPFKSFHIEMKIMTEKISKCDLYGDSTIDMLQLSRYYNFKPLKNKLKELVINNDEFRDFIHTKQRGLLADGWLGYIWEEMGIAEDLFSWFWETTKSYGGKASFFADSCVFGNFDIYNELVKSCDGDVRKLLQFNSATDTVFGMFGIFLRRDIAVKYVHHEKVFLYCGETLAYVIQPQLLLKYKKSLVEDCMFVLDDKDEYEFDILNNPRYHPNERIKFLKMLTNSTRFAYALMYHVNIDQSHIRIELINMIVKLYDSFDNFKNDWMLDEYDDLKDNRDKQEELFNRFKYYIQFLFGIGAYFVDRSQFVPPRRYTPQFKTITQSNTNNICDPSGLNIGTPSENGFKFIDLNDDMIKNDRDLEFFVDTLKRSCDNCNVDRILHDLEHPEYNIVMNQLVLETQPDVSIPTLRFDPVSDIYKFLQRKWNYK